MLYRHKTSVDKRVCVDRLADSPSPDKCLTNEDGLIVCQGANIFEQKEYRGRAQTQPVRLLGRGAYPAEENGTPTPKVNSKTLSSCLVYVFRASCITVYKGFRRLLFPDCSQLLG
jgi:hypothetical protein